jgi:hypothetical protein
VLVKPRPAGRLFRIGTRAPGTVRQTALYCRGDPSHNARLDLPALSKLVGHIAQESIALGWDRFTAEVVFSNPDAGQRGVEALAAAGYEFEYNHDAIDDYGPAVFGTITGTNRFGTVQDG